MAFSIEILIPVENLCLTKKETSRYYKRSVYQRMGIKAYTNGKTLELRDSLGSCKNTKLVIPDIK